MRTLLIGAIIGGFVIWAYHRIQSDMWEAKMEEELDRIMAEVCPDFVEPTYDVAPEILEWLYRDTQEVEVSLEEMWNRPTFYDQDSVEGRTW